MKKYPKFCINKSYLNLKIKIKSAGKITFTHSHKVQRIGLIITKMRYKKQIVH